jgi:hypothetical protein
VSVGAHVLLIGLIALFAARERPADGTAEEGAGAFLLRLLSAPVPPPPPPRKLARPAPPGDDGDWPIDVPAVLRVRPRVNAGADPSPPSDVQAPWDPPGNGTGAGIGLSSTAPVLPAVPPAARRVVYLVDRSISMGPSGALVAARKEVAASLHTLPPGVLFQVVPYNRLAEPLQLDGRRDLIPAELGTVERALRLLDEILPEGATDHARSLRRALLLRPDILFLLTDAGDLHPADVPALVRLLSQGGAILHVVELARGGAARGEGPLALLARDSGGSYRRVAPGR